VFGQHLENQLDSLKNTQAKASMPKRLLVLLAGLMAASYLMISISTSAATIPTLVKQSQTPKGITVSPAFQQVQVLESESQHPLEFTITNNLSSAQTLQLSTADFNELSETGGLFFVGANPTQLQKKYGLAKWLSLPQSSVTIPPKQSTKITAQVLNQPDLNGGGHYGALMLALQNQSKDRPQNNKVALHPIASSLLFVNKVGGDTHKLKLDRVDVSHSMFSLPKKVDIRFYNSGNTHIIPRGTVLLYSPDGKVISQGTINEDSTIILPEVYRKYEVPLKQVGSSLRTGNYKLVVNFRFDGYDQFRSYQTKIFLVTPEGISMILLIALVVICIIYLYKNRRVKRYFSSVFHTLKIKR
jgi:hypothetical protein